MRFMLGLNLGLHEIRALPLSRNLQLESVSFIPGMVCVPPLSCPQAKVRLLFLKKLKLK